ncbi:uncharacterized protein Z519_05361 [Cladophialophora bantiana CBS 173.52]|uniref:Uncharacterized protein n=1 Tax=Cladophialophora bantiana (strain ATCC 10958 / CBS 173.52 / CDC B-1940 / NIH 8579) TaxID=1442370 RepID=A0A0D2HT83_CLAB1|nr:uncharacterized protein Z519_05361 [Cladophialophora bantiana CBS 173.52]KIW94045.1 hypothetical protein Z519_05361 [Cladophialophora bantiana CBS 173.52]
MDREDVDVTPRALRVVNPDLKEDADDLPQLGTRKTTFSPRSISGSLSSIWGRRHATSSQRDFQDESFTVAPDLDLDYSPPSRGCVSFSILLTARKSSAPAGSKKRLNGDRDNKSCSQSRPPVSGPSSNHFTHPQIIQGRFPLDLDDERSSTYSFGSFSTDHSSRHSNKVHQNPAGNPPKRDIFGQVSHTIMPLILPNGIYANGVPTDRDLRNTRPINNHIMAPAAVQAPTLQNILDYRGSLVNEASAPSIPTPVHQNEPLVNGETIPSGPPPSVAGTMNHEDTVALPVDRDFIQPQFDAYHFHDNFRNPAPSHLRHPLQPPPPPPRNSPNVPVVPLPAVAALKVETFAFNVLDAGTKSPISTYVTFDITAIKQNYLETQGHTDQPQHQSYVLMENDEGSLIDLQIQTYVKGPASKLFEVGVQSIQKLRVKDRWTLLLKLNSKDNPLKSKLSASVKSDTNRKSSSLSLIDQFLASLKMDSKRSEPVSVEAVVKYRHAFLPEDTTLETRAVCRLAPLASAASMDTVETGKLAGSIVRALDPGVNTVKLLSVERPEQQHRLGLGGREGLALIYDFRHALGHVVSESVTWDLAVLETYYRHVLAAESAETQTPTLRDTIRRHVATVANRFSPKKSGVAGAAGEGRVG